mgnify:CR=1 FL=1
MAALSTLAMAAMASQAAIGLHQADQQKKAQREASNEARKAAAATEQQAQQANNKANQKAPDMEALLGSASLTGKAGNTLLNGPQGVDPNALLLGKNTLLGQ